MTNAYQNTRLEFHLLQSFPVTCLNRDDVGAPKTAVIGGTTRARVSSQCWKRAVRLALKDLDVSLGIRTKRVERLLSKACLALGASEKQANECGAKMASELADDTLLFISEGEVRKFAEFAKVKAFEPSEMAAKALAKQAKKIIDAGLDALDIALFGRMVAKASEMKIEAACSFAHAISTHAVANEIDFFTALDDFQQDAESAHMGSMEFNSATYYRYICLNLGQLAETLGTEDLGEAVDAFIKALYMAVPSARQTTQTGAAPWEFARVYLRKGQGLQASFESAIPKRASGFVEPSIQALQEYLDKKEALSGSLFGKIAQYDWGQETAFNIDELMGCLRKDIAECIA